MYAEELIQEAVKASKNHSDQLDSQLAFQNGYMQAIIRNLCYIIESARDELKIVQEQLNSIGEL